VVPDSKIVVREMALGLVLVLPPHHRRDASDDVFCCTTATSYSDLSWAIEERSSPDLSAHARQVVGVVQALQQLRPSTMHARHDRSNRNAELGYYRLSHG